MKVLMNVLGILIYFLIRYNGRRQKDKTFSLSFWIKDNWPELLTILLVDVSVLILLLTHDISLNMVDFIPEMFGDFGDLTVAWVLGMSVAAAIYNVMRNKSKSNG